MNDSPKISCSSARVTRWKFWYRKMRYLPGSIWEPVLGADWMEVVHGVYEMAKVTDRIAVLIQPDLLGVA